ncbi:MAG: hypothetical protein EOP48_13065 [Sphingobacteriales bacterium]|nr:MAG: hypothetical protein EOP48_13065 [Sphingobacteriales bacterium]
MQAKILIAGVLFASLISCRTIKPYEYFKLNENQVDSFVGTFTKDKTDSTYMRIEGLFPSLAVADDFKEKYEITYKTKNIEGHKAFYAIEPKDTIYYDASVGPNHFLFSALIFEKGRVLIAPSYYLKDLRRLTFSDFKFVIPEKLSKRDTVRIVDKKKETILHNFRFDDLTIDGKKYNHCLLIDLLIKWPDTTYYSKVWLHKKFGVLKWIRDTGRTDTRLL